MIEISYPHALTRPVIFWRSSWCYLVCLNLTWKPIVHDLLKPESSNVICSFWAQLLIHVIWIFLVFTAERWPSFLVWWALVLVKRNHLCCDITSINSCPWANESISLSWWNCTGLVETLTASWEVIWERNLLVNINTSRLTKFLLSSLLDFVHRIFKFNYT